MICPNVNDIGYKNLARVVGHPRAHTIWSMNNGYAMTHNIDGSESAIYNELEAKYGEMEATKMRSKMFSDDFMELNNSRVATIDAIDSNDNVLTNSGVLFALRDQYDRSPEVLRQRLKTEFINSGIKTEAVLDGLSRALPGIKIIAEDHNSVRGTPFANMRGWVDRYGVHINTSTMHYTTPVHELAHVWIHALEMHSPDKYRVLSRMIDESMEKNPELVKAIRRNYRHLNDNQVRYEYGATIAGLVSKERVENHLRRNNIAPDATLIERIFSSIADIVKYLYENLKSVVSDIFGKSYVNQLDFETSTLEDIFRALTEDYIEGNNVLGLNREEISYFMDRYYSDNFEAQQSNENGQHKIQSTRDIAAWLINNFDKSITENNQFGNEEYVNRFADDIEKRLNVDRNGDKYYYFYNKKYEFPKEWTLTQRLNKIKSDIIPKLETMVNSFNDNIKNVIQQKLVHKNRSLREIIGEVFQDFVISEYKMREIEIALETLGIDDEIASVMNYSELKNHPTLSHLYKPIIEGYDPLIIFHSNDTRSEIDMSIVDLAGGILGRQDNILSSYQFNLASKMGAPNKDFTYSNSKADIRRVVVATTLAGMNRAAKESGLKLKIRRLGVIGFQGRNVSPYMIRSIQEAFNNARKLFMMPDMQILMDKSSPDYSWFESLVEDESAWSDKGIVQTWEARLKSYYHSYYLELGLTAEERDNLVNEMGTWANYDILNARKKAIERQKHTSWINDPEHKILTQYLLYKRRHISIYNSQVDDIHSTFMKMVNPHNVSSDIIQDFSIVAEAAKSKFVNLVNEKKDEFVKLMEASLESHGKKLGFINKPEHIFSHLFKKGTVHVESDTKKYKKGDKVEVLLYNQLYGSYNIAEARAAGLTTEDIAFADYIHNSIKERYIALKMHQSEMYDNPRTEEEVRAEVEGIMKQGSIPVLPSTEEEMYRKGHIWKAIEKRKERNVRAEYTAVDFMASKSSDVHSIFASQIDFDKQLINMGLRRAVGEHYSGTSEAYIGVDMDKYEDSTGNLEYLFNVFMLDNYRKIIIEDEVLPEYNTALQWMNILDSEYHYIQDNTASYLEQYKERIIDRKNRDPKTGIEAKMAGWARSAMALYSFVSLGMRPTVWMRSNYYNVQNQVLYMLASTAHKINTPEEKRLGFPSTGDMAKATQYMATDFKKIYELGRKFGIINVSEMEVIQSIFTTKTDRHIMRKNFAHIGNYYGDLASRLVTMTAFMVHDGSYEAHSINSETGELSYDVRKDKRFYENGKYKSKNAELIHKDIIEFQKRQGLLDADGKQIVGYDFEETNTRFKWYVDKYIIGSMDEYQKVLLGNTYTGQLFTQFRTYLPDKVFNWVGSRRESFYGGQRKVALTEDGQVEVIKEKIRNEGSLNTMWMLIKDIVDLAANKNLSFESLNELINENPMTKYNMSLTIARAIMGITILGALKVALDSGMSKRDRDKLQFLYGNILLWSEYDNLRASAMPLIGLVDNSMSIIMGKGNWKRILLRYTGPVNDAIWYYELFTNTDDVMPSTWRQKKIDEMNEKEREIHEAKKAKRREEERQKKLDSK